MKMYEYKFIYGILGDRNIQARIAALGKDGWMLAAATPLIEPTRDWMTRQTGTVVLMREVQHTEGSDEEGAS